MTIERDSPNSPDPISRELMRQAQLIGQLRRDLDELAHSTTDIAADLLERLKELDEDSAPTYAPRSWCWRDLGPKASEELLSELTDWVGWLRRRYPLARKIPPCWPHHPEIVEELTSLWLAWQYAYTHPGAPLNAAIEWHDHWLPGLLHRLQSGPLALDCSDEHATRPPSAYASQSDT